VYRGNRKIIHPHYLEFKVHKMYESWSKYRGYESAMTIRGHHTAAAVQQQLEGISTAGKSDNNRKNERKKIIAIEARGDLTRVKSDNTLRF
jgi:hypothetical protein